MGFFVDIVILSRESVYMVNFMKYGFMSGMGVIFIVFEKLGFSLVQEILMNVGSYCGVDFEKRGVFFKVFFCVEVVDYVVELVYELVEKLRNLLIILKDYLVVLFCE